MAPDRALFDAVAPTLIATTGAAPGEVRASWEARGAEVAVLEEEAGPGRFSPTALMQLLGKRDIQNVLIEGGPTFAWSALESGTVDRLALYLAPKLIGGAAAPSVLAGAGVPSIGEALGVSIVSIEWLGDDLRVMADVHRNR
jgi:diaminohydroxyphosphoribosylaminopyrimidine deaminase/5-amino-6-(5-phosphoribosylamino)uracil reductase